MCEPIRILHMIGSLEIGGSQAMIMNLYENIDRNQIQFDFIVDHPERLYFAEQIKRLGGRIYFMPTFKGKNIFEIKKKWNKFFIDHPEYKIIHSHVRSYASLYLPIAKKNGLITIIHSHSTSNGKGVLALIKKFLQYPLRYQADYFFGCSKEAGEWLFGKKVVNSKRYFMLQNAIDIRKYNMSEHVRRQYREILGIENSTKVFIHVGRLHEAKNHLFLLEVFAEYLKAEKNSLLLIVGDGDLKKTIEEKMQSLNINNNVMLLGARSDVANLLQVADCFLFPSKWEGLPVTVVEAQAAGLPCLISDTVTNEVNVSELVKRLPIDYGVDPWVEAMEKTNFIKIDVSKDIKKAGFDIHSSANWLSSFYMELIEDE